VTDPEFAAEHYSQAAFEFETKRLTELCPVEFTMTKRMLDRWIPDGARIAEVEWGSAITPNIWRRAAAGFI
jgi:hypothetical protein